MTEQTPVTHVKQIAALWRTPAEKTAKGEVAPEMATVKLFAATLESLIHLAKALTAAEARIAELESGPLKYEGPHESGRTYERGTFVTRSGSLWHCNRRTNSRPGEDAAWTLAVKAGRNAR